MTLPNPRGEPYDPFVGMFEDDDPNYNMDALGEGERAAAAARLRLIPEEFQDRNRMVKIVERNRARLTGTFDESGHLALLEASQWSKEAVLSVIESAEEEEKRNLEKMRHAQEEAIQVANRPTPSVKKALLQAWKSRRNKD